MYSCHFHLFSCTFTRVLAVLINSGYSFWWDVTNDWGLDILNPSSWSKASRKSYHLLPQSSSSPLYANAELIEEPLSPTLKLTHAAHARKGSLAITPSSSTSSTTSTAFLVPPLPATSRSTSPTPDRYSQPYPIGLRPRLLYRPAFIYYAVVAFNFVLRFTWSLKLSSHLYSVADLESGIFLMEAAELVRRWIWVFFRVEWEAIKKESASGFDDIPLSATPNGNAMELSQMGQPLLRDEVDT